MASLELGGTWMAIACSRQRWTFPARTKSLPRRCENMMVILSLSLEGGGGRTAGEDLNALDRDDLADTENPRKEKNILAARALRTLMVKFECDWLIRTSACDEWSPCRVK